MKKCCQSAPLNCPNVAVKLKTKSHRECHCYQENSPPKDNVKVCKTNPPVSARLYPALCAACVCQKDDQTRATKKTWLDLLRESPRKAANTNPNRCRVGGPSSSQKRAEIASTTDVGENIRTTKRIGEDVAYDVLGK